MDAYANNRLCSLQTDVDSDKIQVAIRVPVHLTYNIEEGGETPVNCHLRSPIVVGHVQSQEEAEARMQGQLLAFDKKFGHGVSSSENSRY